MERVQRISSHVYASLVVEAQLQPKSVNGGQTFNAGKPLTITIIGSGNSGHVCAALFQENTNGLAKTQLLTSRPHIWKNRRPCVSFPNGAKQVGHIDKVSSDPAELLPQSDIVLWTGPVTTTKDVFENIRPYIDLKKTAVGTIFAQGLTHVLAHRVFGPEVKFFALRNIPWLCKMVTLGEESAIIGPKTGIGVMTINLDKAWIKSQLEPLFVTQKIGKWEPVMDMLPDFCPVVFNPANQIIHPARYWAMFRSWNGQPLSGAQEPGEWLYRDFDEVAGNVLAVLDEELQALKDAYFAATGEAGCKDVIPLRDRLLDQYGDQIKDTSTLAKMVGTNAAYHMAKTPVIRTKLGVMPNPTHRVVTDDIGWGLCVLVSIAERLEAAGVKTSTVMMRMLIEWHQKLLGKEYLYNGELRGRDCAELVLLRPEDPLELVARAPTGASSSWIEKAESMDDDHRIGNP